MIIVTGGAGFIGSALVWKLNALGYNDILITDHDAEGSPKWKNLQDKKFSDYLEADEFLKKIQKNSLAEKCEAVFHMGACTDTTETDTDYLKRNNVEFSKTLAGWAIKNNSRFLYASSAATYGAGECGYSDEDRVTPKLKPLNDYGRSKQEFDLWVLENKLQLKIAGFKFFNVFGPNEYHKGHMRSVVHKGYEQIKKEGKIRLFESYRNDYKDGEQLRDFVYVKDVAEVLMWFFKKPDKNGIYNLGTGNANSWNSLAFGIFEALRLQPDIKYISMPDNLRAQYQYHTQAKLEKLRATGFQREFQSFHASIKDYVLNYLEKKSPYL